MKVKRLLASLAVAFVVGLVAPVANLVGNMVYATGTTDGEIDPPQSGGRPNPCDEEGVAVVKRADQLRTALARSGMACVAWNFTSGKTIEVTQPGSVIQLKNNSTITLSNTDTATPGISIKEGASLEIIGEGTLKADKSTAIVLYGGTSETSPYTGLIIGPDITI